MAVLLQPYLLIVSDMVAGTYIAMKVPHFTCGMKISGPSSIYNSL